MLHRLTARGTRIIIESLEISLRSDIINKEDGARLSIAWLPAYEILKSKSITQTTHTDSPKHIVIAHLRRHKLRTGSNSVYI